MYIVILTALGVGGATVVGALLGFLFKGFSDRFGNMIISFAAGIMSYGAERIGLISSGGTVMIGALMLLVPGIAFGTAIRDLISGDLLAGTLKTVQCILSALMIAAGYILSVAILGGI